MILLYIYIYIDVCCAALTKGKENLLNCVNWFLALTIAFILAIYIICL